MRTNVRVISALLLVLGGLLIAGVVGALARPAPADGRYFPETRHAVQGPFLAYWTAQGGLAQQGYPLTEPFREVSALNGQPYTVQYFERAVFEAHPENAPPYDVLLSQLGTFQYRQKYPHGAPGQTADQANGHYFPETRHWVGGKFWAYWQSHGGLAQQGYPLSEEFTERSALNGQSYTVQYFERAVFELHPENAPPYDVLLSQLGTTALAARYPHNSNPAAAPVPVPGTPPPAGGPPAVQATADIPLIGGTARFDYQSLDPQTGRLFIAHLGASLVTVFDVQANRVLANIPAVASVHGVLAVPALGRVYASATGDNQVAVIDESREQVVARIPGGEYPDGLAYDPITQHVFVSDETGGTDTVIDTATNTRMATIPLGGEAGNTYYDAGSGRMFVAVQTRNQLVALDPATNTVVGRTDLPGCDHPHGLLIDMSGRRAFVACDANARLLTVDLTTLQVRDVQTVDATPDVLAWDPTWQRLYVAAESGGLAIFDLQGATPRKLVSGFFAAGAHTVAVDPATHRVFLPLANSGGGPVLRVVQYAAP